MTHHDIFKTIQAAHDQMWSVLNGSGKGDRQQLQDAPDGMGTCFKVFALD